MPNSRRRIKLEDIRRHAWLQGAQSVVEPVEPIINQNVLDVMARVGIGDFSNPFPKFNFCSRSSKNHRRSSNKCIQRTIRPLPLAARQGKKSTAKLQTKPDKPSTTTGIHWSFFLFYFQMNRQFQPQVDQYGFPTMHCQGQQQPLPQQQQQVAQQQYRRHTVNNVLSTITPNQQQSLQQMYRVKGVRFFCYFHLKAP